jgi:DNA-binding MarR family transcriptional regulator
MTSASLDALLYQARTFDLGAGTLHALCIICEEPISLTDLARRIGVTSCNITGIADRLTDLGFAERQASKSDRRRIRLKATDTGKEALTEILTAAEKASWTFAPI